MVVSILKTHTLNVGLTSSFAMTKEADVARASTESAAPRIGKRTTRSYIREKMKLIIPVDLDTAKYNHMHTWHT